MSVNIQGVDISYCQSGLNYEKLKSDGIKFAIIRASYTGTGTHSKELTHSLTATSTAVSPRALITASTTILVRSPLRTQRKKRSLSLTLSRSTRCPSTLFSLI